MVPTVVHTQITPGFESLAIVGSHVSPPPPPDKQKSVLIDLAFVALRFESCDRRSFVRDSSDLPVLRLLNRPHG